MTTTMMQLAKQMLDQQFSEVLDAQPLVALSAEQLSYQFAHPIQLFDQLAHLLHQDAISLQQQFGAVIFAHICQHNPEALSVASDCFALFQQPDTPLQLEIARLYDNRPPARFTILRLDANQLVMDYQSSLPFGHVCRGFLRCCCDYFAESMVIRQQLLGGALNHVRFELIRSARQHRPDPATAAHCDSDTYHDASSETVCE